MADFVHFPHGIAMLGLPGQNVPFVREAITPSQIGSHRSSYITVLSMIREVHSIVKDVFEKLQYLQAHNSFELITAQRILINCKIDIQTQQLQL